MPDSADGKHRRAACVRSFYIWESQSGSVSPQIIGLIPTISRVEETPEAGPRRCAAPGDGPGVG